MVNNTGGHKQRRFKHGMVDNMKNSSDSGQIGIEAQQQRDKTKMRNGRIG